MDFVSTAASVIQLAGAGLSLAKTIFEIYQEGAEGNKQLKELSMFINTTSTILEEIGNAFQNESKLSKPIISENAILTAVNIIKECSDSFDAIREVVNKAQTSTAGLLRLQLKKSQLASLQSRLSNLKEDLALMLQVLTLAHIKSQNSQTDEETCQRVLVVENNIKKSYISQQNAHDREPTREVTAYYDEEGQSIKGPNTPDFSPHWQVNMPPKCQVSTNGNQAPEAAIDQSSSPRFTEEIVVSNPKATKISYWSALSITRVEGEVQLDRTTHIEREDSRIHATLPAPRVYGREITPAWRDSLEDDIPRYYGVLQTGNFDHDTLSANNVVDRLLREWTTLYSEL
ncbi:uncharacterized protein N7483_009678 [Penicillium malachiteum]|uniref:uncharacterized protein n=1 Tax=Penicillium malachiteum TaxID=1324776 RepID=UPI002548988A|nr:uncharacterized protein N7483_009678 [Penicillium malachiteum]KAJ5721744.1 hypothetical protein N7483_009678 [Penicillium malachiteum]